MAMVIAAICAGNLTCGLVLMDVEVIQGNSLGVNLSYMQQFFPLLV